MAIIIAVLVISWRCEIVGAIAFAAGALVYAIKAMKHPDWVLWIAGPLPLVAILFFLNWLYRKELRVEEVGR
jgi:hypothetical protein